MRVLLTRPEEQALRSAARLAQLGHEAIVAPLIEIVPTGDALPAEPYDAVLVTSAHAFDRLDAAPRLLRAPFVCVGERTAAAAQHRGFAPAVETAGDSPALATLIEKRFAPPARLLYLAGHNRKPDLEARLRSAGYSIDVVVVYEARAVSSLPGDAAAALRQHKLDAVAHYSRRSAEIFVELTRQAGLWAAAAGLLHGAISADAAAPLESCPRVRIAAAPNESGLFAALVASEP